MRIAVLSRNGALYSTQSLINAGRNRGHEMWLVDHVQCDIQLAKGKHEIYFQSEKLEGIDAIIPRIGSSVTGYGAAVIKQFEHKGVFTTLPSDGLTNSRNKLTCLQIMAKHDIDIPISTIVNNSYAIPEVLDRMDNYPLIIKLTNSTHGLGVMKADNRSTAESLLETFVKLRQKVLIQEFIEESKGADVRVFIVGDEIVGVMQRQAKPGEFRSNLHRGGSSFVVELTKDEAFVAKKAARVLGLSVAGVDMLRSKRGPLILEVNASPGLEGIEGTTQVDIAGKIIEYIERNGKAGWRKI